MLKVNLISILEIDEVGQKLSNQFNLFITWYDFRLKLYNMKKNLNMNTLTQAEKGTIWVPKLVFTNTKKKDITQNDEKSFAVARRDSDFEYSSETVKYNIFIFDGKNNPFVMSRVYDVDWICDYDMRWYPFDIQTCKINLELKGNLADFIDIVPDKLEYLGPEALTQYFIKHVNISTEVLNKKYGVVVSITLGRRLLGTILTAYIPTVLLIIISHNASFFKPFFFESAISVNVTTMLVLVTLFISVSGSLPTTSYIKMMDIWMIFNLMIPFCEVLLHTYIDNLRQEGDEEREINHHGEKRKVETKSPEKELFKKVKSYNPNLVSRREQTQDKALKNFYRLASVSNQFKLKVAMRIVHSVIPVIAATFTVICWILGFH